MPHLIGTALTTPGRVAESTNTTRSRNASRLFSRNEDLADRDLCLRITAILVPDGDVTG